MNRKAKVIVFSLVAIIATHVLIAMELQHRLNQGSLSQNEARLRLSQYKDP